MASLRSAALAIVAAFGVPATTDAAAMSACTARASITWSPTEQASLTIEAFSDGPSCSAATATVAIRAPDGAVLWTLAIAVADSYEFQQATTPATMQDALQRWIDPAYNAHSRSGQLPPWPSGAEMPDNDIGLYTTDSYSDRNSYEMLRAEDHLLYCIVTGTENAVCLAYRDGWIAEVGYEAFAG